MSDWDPQYTNGHRLWVGSDQIHARPVWARHIRRTYLNISPMPEPTEEEKHDAIRVLEDPTNEAVPNLWLEAHRIFTEASE